MKLIYKNEIVPALIISLIIIILFLIYKENKSTQYKQKGALASAWVTGFEYDYKGRLQLKYEFYINETKIEGSTSFPELKGGSEKYLVGHYLPVTYLKDNLKDNELLASPKKFQKFSLQRPDSLAWLDKLEIPW